jgi:hypothetical protein
VDHAHDLKGNNDLLILTQPDAMRDIHLDYFRAGSDIVETNTFSGTSIAQADYGMEAIVYELNREGARLAREAAAIAQAEDGRRRFVAGAIGPTNRTLSISPDVNNPGARNVTFEALREAYLEATLGLIAKPVLRRLLLSDLLLGAARGLIGLGFEITATRGTADWLAAQGVTALPVNKVYEGRPNIVDALKNGEIALVMNTTEGAQSITDSRDIRRVALMDKIAYFTTAAGAIAAVAAMTGESMSTVAMFEVVSVSSTASRMASVLMRRTPGAR